MDWDSIAALAALVGTGLAGAFCWWRFQRGRSRYVPVADSLHESLQEFLNATIWMAAFTAVFLIVMQPALAIQFGMPSGWSMLAGGVLALVTVHSPLLKTIRGWMEIWSLSTERSLFRERLGREMSRARQDRRAPLAVAPFFATVTAYIVLGHGDGERGIVVYWNNFSLGYLHVIAALAAVIGWQALRNLQRDIRSGLTEARVIDDAQQPAVASAGSTPPETDTDERTMPPFHIQVAKLVYEVVTGAAVGSAIWFGLPYTYLLPGSIWIACWIVAAIGAVVVWRRVDSLWRPTVALGLTVAIGLFAIVWGLVFWVGVPEAIAWGLGFGVGALMLLIVLPLDDRWRGWFQPERERWELTTALAGILFILAFSTVAYRVLGDRGELIFHCLASVIVLIAWIRTPERLMSYSAQFIALLIFSFPLIVPIEQPGIGFGLGLGVLLLGKLRERFGPRTGGDDVPPANWQSLRSSLRPNPFTNERRDLLTHLTPEECVRRIERGTYEPLGGRRRRTHHTPEEEKYLPPIEAHASTAHLSLAKFRGRRTYIWTVATATLMVTPDGTYIRARAGMHSGFRVLYGLLGMLVLPALVLSLIAVFRDPSQAGGGVSAFSLVLVATGVAIVIPRALDDESRELLDFLQTTLDASLVNAEPRWRGIIDVSAS